MTAEFSRHYVNSLRYYRKPSTPADFTRPKTTKGARYMAKTRSSSVTAAQTNPYMKSQTLFMKNKQIQDNTRKMFDY